MEYTVIDTMEEYADMLRYISSFDKPLVYLDTETTGLDVHTSKLLLLQMNIDNKKIYVVDFTKLSDSIIVSYDIDGKSLKYLLENAELVIIHNAVFDFKVMLVCGVDLTNNVFCTLIAEQLIQAGYRDGNKKPIKCGLADTTERRCGVLLDKAVRNDFINFVGVLEKSHYDYAAIDVYYLPEIYRQQLEQIKKEKLERVLYDIEIPCIPITAHMEYVGINIDENRLDKAKPVLEHVVEKAEKGLQRFAFLSGTADEILFEGDSYTVINISSPPQMNKFANSIGIKVDTMGAKELADWDARWSIKNKHKIADNDDDIDYDDDGDDEDRRIDLGYNHPFLKLYSQRKAASKILDTYIIGIKKSINQKTKRVHPSFKQLGAARTGRYSSSGPNFQNMPQIKKLKDLGIPEYNIRSMFIPSPGRKMIISDYSAVELVMIGILSRDEKLLYQVVHGDIHSFVAEAIFKYPVDKKLAGDHVEPHDTYRNVAKTLTYAIAYGTGGRNLYRTLSLKLSQVGFNMKPADGDEWIRIWKNDLFPATGRLLKENGEKAVIDGYVSTITGRRRHWNGNFANQWEMYAAQREGANSPIQGSSADLTKMAMIRWHELVDTKRATLLACIHDELLIEADEDYAQECARLTKIAMESPAVELFGDIAKGYITADPKISDKYDK